MKKILFAVIAIAALVFAGCEKGEDGFNYDKNQIYGTWRVTHLFTEEDGYFSVIGYPAENVFEPTYITFDPNGSFNTHGYFGSAAGTFKMVGQKTIITYFSDGEEIFRYDILSMTGTTGEAEMYDKSAPTDRMRMKVAKQ